MDDKSLTRSRIFKHQASTTMDSDVGLNDDKLARVYPQFAKSGPPRVAFRACYEFAESTEASFVLFAYTNLHSALPTGNWGPPPETPRLFDIKPIPGKGVGIFASRDIKAGEVIHRERFLLARPAALIVQDSAPDDIQEKILEAAISLLPPRLRQKFIDLANSEPEEDFGPLTGRLLTNGIAISFDEVDVLHTYAAIFPDISRANHSCCPNAEYGRLHSSSASIELRASYNIRKDEEIAISYIHSLSPRATRRETLLKCYKFHCDCESCILSSDADVEASDNRREMISQRSYLFERDPYAEKRLKWWIDDRTVSEQHLILWHMEVLEAMEKEKINTNRAEHCGVIAACYAALGDEENTTKWCKTADAMCKIDIRNPNTELKNIWKDYVDSPRNHRLWGYRTPDAPSVSAP